MINFKKPARLFATLTVLLLGCCNTLCCFAANDGNTDDAIVSISTTPPSPTNSSEKFKPAVCDIQCQQDLQKMLDTYRLKYQTIGMSLGVSLSAQQPTLNFYSGTTTKDGTTPLNKNSLFEIGSATKEFTAALILQLEAEGKLTLDDTVGQWLQYPDWNQITIRELLNMTSGIYNYSHLNNWAEKFLSNHFWYLGEQCDDAYANLPNTNFLPGEDWEYSNTNYILAGMIIEKASNKSVQANMQDLILKPNHLENTLYDMTIFPDVLPNIVHGYLNFPPYVYRDTTNLNLSGQQLPVA